MFLLWHPWLTTTNLSYSFPLLETSATALCGTTGISELNVKVKDLSWDVLPCACFGKTMSKSKITRCFAKTIVNTCKMLKCLCAPQISAWNLDTGLNIEINRILVFRLPIFKQIPSHIVASLLPSFMQHLVAGLAGLCQSDWSIIWSFTSALMLMKHATNTAWCLRTPVTIRLHPHCIPGCPRFNGSWSVKMMTLAVALADERCCNVCDVGLRIFTILLQICVHVLHLCACQC